MYIIQVFQRVLDLGFGDAPAKHIGYYGPFKTEESAKKMPKKFENLIAFWTMK